MIKKLRCSLLSNEKPQDENVMWIDTSNPESFTLKLFRNGDWKPLHVVGTTRDMIERELTGYVTSHYHSYDRIINKPTTLTGYGITDCFNKTEIESLLNKKVTKVSGKSLSTNDFNNEYKKILDELPISYYNKNELDNLFNDKQDIITDLNNIREGAEKGKTALQRESDPVYLADKPSLLLEINGKVSKEAGKGLSSNDFTNEEKSKLTNLENYDDTEIKKLINKKANDADLAKVAKTGKYSDLVDEPIAQSSQVPTSNEPLWINPDEDQEEVAVYNRSQVDALHQSIVNSITSLSESGYLFSGVATSETAPGTPGAKVFYIANGKGTYTNFGGIQVTEDEVVVLYYDTAWHKVSTGIASNQKLSELEKEIKGFVKESLWMTSTSGDYITQIDIKLGEEFSFKYEVEGDLGRVTVFPNGNNSLDHRIKDSASSEFLPNKWYYAVAKENISRLGMAIFNASSYKLFFRTPTEIQKTIEWVKEEGNVDEKKLANGAVSLTKLSSELAERIIKSNDYVTSALEKEILSNNDQINSFFKELYITNIKEFNRIQIVKEKYYDNTKKFRNMIRFWRSDNSYITAFIQEESTIEGLQEIETDVLPFAVVDWDSINSDTERYIYLDGVTFLKDVSNIQNAPTIAAIVNFHSIRTVNSSKTELDLPSSTNNLILKNGSRAVLSKDASILLDKFIHSLNIKAPSKVNIIEPYEKRGRFERIVSMIYQFDGEAVVLHKNVNPTYEKRNYQNSTVAEIADGSRKVFSLPFACNDKKDVKVYLNGARLLLGVDYDVIASNGLLVFSEAPKENAKIVVDYNVEVESFIANYSFNKLEYIDYKFKGNDDTLEYNDATFYSFERGWISAYYPLSEDKPNAISVDIVPSPTDEKINVLHFHAEDIGAQSKIRAQIQIGNTTGKEIENSIDVYFPSEVKTMLETEGEWDSLPSGGHDINNWFTLQEWWVYGVTSSGAIGQRFRMSLNIVKTEVWDGECYFALSCEEIDNNGSGQEFTFLYRLDDRINKKFPIPFGEWFTLKTYIKGGVTNGKFILSVVRNDGQTIEVFNQSVQTLPAYALTSSGVDASYGNYNGVETPIKMYFSDDIMNYMKSIGQSVDIYFKNWFYKNTGVLEI